MQAFLPMLLTRPRASLVNVSSMGALVPVPGQTAYEASKAAVKLLREGLYAELREMGVAVTAVYPGGVATQIADNSGCRGAERATDQPRGGGPSDPRRARERALPSGHRGDARLLDLISRLRPRWATEFVARRMANLLSSATGHGVAQPS